MNTILNSILPKPIPTFLKNCWIKKLDLECQKRRIETADGTGEMPWRPYSKGGFLDVDAGELVGFAESDDWDLLDDDDDFNGEDFAYADDEVWTYS
jgi:hypothetical protein